MGECGVFVGVSHTQGDGLQCFSILDFLTFAYPLMLNDQTQPGNTNVEQCVLGCEPCHCILH